MAEIAFSDNDTRRREHESHTGSVHPLDPVSVDRSAAELRAHAAQKLASLGEMTGGIAHDFRNLLTVIESGMRLAEKYSDEPEKVRAHIAAAREGINRGVSLTSQLLTFAKQHELEAHAGDVNELLKNLELFLRYSSGPGICIDMNLAPDIPKCLIDPSQFNAAVLNLVVNARDAMPNGGHVEISTSRYTAESKLSGSPPVGTYVRVRVKDSGQGMPADVIAKIFDPFFTTKGETGTGLGLPQVRAFMRLIGGHIGVVSEPGFGTTFDLFFRFWPESDLGINAG